MTNSTHYNSSTQDSNMNTTVKEYKLNQVNLKKVNRTKNNKRNLTKVSDIKKFLDSPEQNRVVFNKNLDNGQIEIILSPDNNSEK